VLQVMQLGCVRPLVHGAVVRSTVLGESKGSVCFAKESQLLYLMLAALEDTYRRCCGKQAVLTMRCACTCKPHMLALHSCLCALLLLLMLQVVVPHSGLQPTWTTVSPL
jgi:hypothetical protein